VERSSDDSSIVVTTYEGQHTHPSPATSRPNLSFVHQPTSFVAASGSRSHFLLPTLLYNNTTTTTPPSSSYVGGSSGSYVNTSSFGGFVNDQVINHRGFGSSGFVNEALLRDNGLLQDIIQMKKEENDSRKEQH